MRSAPAIPFFGDAYLADTRHLSLEEHGAYLQLLMIAWRVDGCRLPDDDARLARMLGITGAKWRKLKPVVMDFWTLENGHWTQRRLSKERAFVEEKSAKNSASAKARWDGQTTENKEAGECERISERNAPPPPPPPTVEEKVEAKASPQKKPEPRGFRLPDDWQPRPLTGQTALMVQAWPPGMLERQLAQFRDHYLKTPGAKGRSLDWDASLRTWLRNADDWRAKDGRSNGNITGLRGSRPDPALDLVRQGDAQLAAERSREAADRGAWASLPAVRTG